MKVRNYADIVAILIAVFSLIVSVRSCEQAERITAIEQTKLEDERSFIYVSRPLSEFRLALKPSNNSVIVDYIDLTLPSALRGKHLVPSIVEPDFILNLDALKMEFNNALIPRMKKNPVNKRSEFSFKIPFISIVLETKYIADNQIRKDRSVYGIQCWAEVSTDNNGMLNLDKTGKPKVEVTSLSALKFIRRLNSNEDSKSIVEESWSQSISSLEENESR